VVLALLIAELREDRRAQFFFKPMAALGFILMALQFGVLESRYGIIILLGLTACAFGDVFLLSRKSENLFKTGMLAFAIGHIIYVFAFLEHGLIFGAILNEKPIDLPVSITLIISVITALYFVLKANRNLRIPIVLYTLIIGIMISASFLTKINIITAAILFAVSDIFVAQDRFVKRSPKNALAITPLYFGAQALFALSVSI
jgi:uncharacterized membrane protein YhhN